MQGTGLELRFLATRTSDSNSYSVMAIDSLLTNGTVLRDDRMQRCTMQMSVTGTFFDSIRTIDKALVVEQPPDELMTQTPSFVITVLSGEELFLTHLPRWRMARWCYRSHAPDVARLSSRPSSEMTAIREVRTKMLPSLSSLS